MEGKRHHFRYVLFGYPRSTAADSEPSGTCLTACCRPAVPTHLKKAPSLSAPLPRPAGGRDRPSRQLVLSQTRSHKVVTTTAAGPPARPLLCSSVSPALPPGARTIGQSKPRVTDSSFRPGLRPVRGPARSFGPSSPHLFRPSGSLQVHRRLDVQQLRFESI